VNIENVGDLIQRARAEAASKAAAKPEANPGSERDRLMRVAQEFESMLMLQMLKEMRKAGSWEDDEQSEGGFGAQTMFETIDVELAGHLAKAQGLGLGKQLMDAFQRMQPEGKGMDESGGLDMPAGDITSGFGWRADPFHGAAKFHRGIDIRSAYGQDVPSAGAGRVVSAGTQGGYGQTVVVEHADGLRTRYAHLSTTLVAPGDDVRAGQAVGRAGNSGRATGTHLHFEVTTASGEPLNPEQFAGLKAEGLVADFTAATSHGLRP